MDASGIAANAVFELAPSASGAAHAARCAGPWTIRGIAELERRIDAEPWPTSGALVVDASQIEALDTAGAWLIHRTVARLRAAGVDAHVTGLRPELAALAKLVSVRGEQVSAPPTPASPGTLETVGRKAWTDARNATGFLAFAGESFTVLLRSLARPRRIRWRAVMHNVQTAGFDALPITGLLSFLMGIVIAYQGADQLRRFGANIFVADLVGIAMLRELSPLLTAIIVAGRSGSAYAAQIGTMKVTEEIDALRTVGIAPMEVLVLPKILALMIALPLLTVYADILGVAGGMVMAKSELGVNYPDFIDRLQYALRISDFAVGIGKAPVFAAIIAVVGCFQGFQVSGDAESVGRKTTISVVQSIFLVIVADSVFSVVFNYLGI